LPAIGETEVMRRFFINLKNGLNNNNTDNINVEKGSPFDKSRENIIKEEPEKGKTVQPGKQL